MNSEYVLTSRWDVAVGRDELWDVLEALLGSDDPMVWWPSVQVTGYAGGVLDVRAASGLGYAVTFQMRDLVMDRPTSMTFAATGDLRGAGRVDVHGAGADRSTLEIDWRVATDRRWMRWTGWLLRPVFVRGHHLVMARGERQFNEWLAQRDSPGHLDLV